MKLPSTIYDRRFTICQKSVAPSVPNRQSAIGNCQFQRAFTLIEIAISMAIIGFALVVILGLLPLGMNTQRDNREETIINQDATVLIDTIRSGAIHSDFLTNYVYAITNYWTNLTTHAHGENGYTYTSVSVDASKTYPNGPYSFAPITNGANIIGLLSTPEFIADFYLPPNTNFPPVVNEQYAYDHYGVGCYSNHVVAYVRAISGLAAERPPQTNDTLITDSLTYKLLAVNAPIPVDTNTINHSPFAQNLAASQRELRLTFIWPLMPNGRVLNNGASPLTFRATVAGSLTPTNYNDYLNQWLYFYQSQSFTNAP